MLGISNKMTRGAVLTRKIMTEWRWMGKFGNSPRYSVHRCKFSLLYSHICAIASFIQIHRWKYLFNSMLSWWVFFHYLQIKRNLLPVSRQRFDHIDGILTENCMSANTDCGEEKFCFRSYCLWYLHGIHCIACYFGIVFFSLICKFLIAFIKTTHTW